MRGKPSVSVVDKVINYANSGASIQRVKLMGVSSVHSNTLFKHWVANWVSFALFFSSGCVFLRWSVDRTK